MSRTLEATGTHTANVKRSRLTLILIFVLFALPLVVAWILNFKGGFTPGETSNNGTLIQPVRPVSATGVFDMRGVALNTDYFKGKWTLLYRHVGDCGETCHQTLYTVRQVRLAQGKNIDRVQRLLLLDGAAMPTWVGELAKHYPGLTVARTATGKDAELFGTAGRVYLVDPLGNVMMEYALDANPRGMIKDLERLLLISYVG
jgi:cytochrome oxidase Cu insertion factor (SCO1/SenC/PrrC family)